MGTHLDLDDVAAGHPLAQKELAELRKDAERYRWLRDEAFLATATRIVQMLPGHMDAEIDTAMSGANTN